MTEIRELRKGRVVTIAATGRRVKVLRRGRMGTLVRDARKRKIVINGETVGEAAGGGYMISSGTEVLER
jgi:hypothetical protein